MNGDMFTVISDLRGRIAQLEGELLAHQDMLPLRAARIAAQAAEIEHLKSLNAEQAKVIRARDSQRANGVGQWSPCIDDADLKSADGLTEFHTMFCGTGLFIDDGDCAMLPDGYAVCKRNQGDYVTVSRGYLENLERVSRVWAAKIEELSE